jgi:hypothetical protein
MAWTQAEICNMALSNLGLDNNVVDIDDPESQTEKIFSQFYNLVLNKTLKRERPQFAIYDESIPPTVFSDGSLHYMVPSYALEVLRINGQTQGWTIEHGEIIFIDSCVMFHEDDNIDIKFVRALTDTGLFTEEFVELLSWELALYCCGRLTQDANMLQLAAAGVQGARQEYQTINLRSAKPRLKTQSKFNRVWRR